MHDSGTSSRPHWYWLTIVALPALVLWHRDNALFTPAWFTDPWYYLGYFRTLVDFKRDLYPDAYFGSRLSWILPGFAIHWLFAPVIANFILHIGVHSVCSLSFFATLRRCVGRRIAFLATLVFCLHPWLWAATGWDYVNGAGIAYLLLAMAALTRAAERADGRGNLVIAGASIAGMVYAHFLWLTLAPLLMIYYAGLVWAWRRVPFPRLARDSTPWLALGFGMVTLALVAANYAVAGTVWFYGVSWSAAMRAAGVFTTAPGVWGANGLEPWLWFPLIAATAAAVLLPFRLLREAPGQVAPALLFSTQLLLAMAWMGYLQSRGIAMLGFYHYAAYLIPFAFLASGALFWGAVDYMSERVYVLTCCAAAAGFAAVWYATPPAWMVPALHTALLGTVLVGGGLALGHRPAGTWLALAGLLCLSAHSLTQTAALHGSREQYRRIMDERERVELARNHDRVRFWFDEREPGSSEYAALNSLYLDARLSTAFPQDGCDVGVQPGTLIVVPSVRADAAELARRVLSDCWRSSSMKAVVVATDAMAREGQPYMVVLLRAETDLTAQRPLQVIIERGGTGLLELASGSESAAFPLAGWSKESPMTVLETIAAQIEVRTPRGDYAYTMAYPQLTAPLTGRYRFALRYSHAAGEFAFGAFPADNSRWLAASTVGYRRGNEREIAVTVDLKAGEGVILRVANNNNHRDSRAASFRMLGLSATVAAPQ